MKIVLANLPWKIKDKWGVRAGSRWPHIKGHHEGAYLPFPFFLAYAASLLKKNGYEVHLIDGIAEKSSYEDFIDRVRKMAPDFIVAETSTASLYNDIAIIKRLSRFAKPIICGPDINITQKEFLEEHKYIEYVLIGEYEATLLDLIEHLNNNKALEDVRGIIYRKDNGIVKNPERPLLENLDFLPWPMREALPMDRYFDIPGDLSLPSVQMLSSRGCPYKCTFCAWPQIMFKKGSYRTRSAKNVVDEMEYMVNYYGFKSIYFDDDTWNVGKQRVIEFCKEIESRNLKNRLNVPWAIMARPDLMDEEMLSALKKAGLHSVKYGIESANQAILDASKKNMDLNKAEKMIRLTMAMGIKTHLTFTFGLPGETKKSIENSIDFALKLNPESAQFSITTPYPGTEYFSDLDKKGQLLTKDWSKYDGNHKAVFNGDLLTAEDLEKALERAYEAWGSHCRFRQQAPYKVRTKRLISKVWKYLRSKGFFYLCYKIYDYTKFLVKRSNWYQDLCMDEIGNGRLKIRYGLGKVKVFWNNTELTKGVGLNTSISIYKNWLDSSKADWVVLKKTKNSIIMRNDWRNVPLSQEWRLYIAEENIINWEINSIYKEDISLDVQKAGIMLSEKYNSWTVGNKRGKFNMSRNWQEINIKGTSDRKIMAGNLSNLKFPIITLDFSSNGFEGIPQIQSSSRDLNARFIHAKFEKYTNYKAGQYEFFKGNVFIATER